MEHSRFNGLTLTFETLKKKVLALPSADIAPFRDKALYLFVADMLDWFEAYPALDTVRIEHRIETEARGDFNIAISTTHAVNLYAPEAGFDRAANPKHHDEYVLRMLPFTAWGPGQFELHRSDFRVQRFLSLAETEVLEWESLVAGLAIQMDTNFGQVRQVHALSE